jgi:heat shock protein HslJ
MSGRVDLDIFRGIAGSVTGGETMRPQFRAVGLLALASLSGCSSSQPAERRDASFVNRVWSVAESKQVAAGDLRVFLSDGTLLMASSHGTPSLGTWRPRESGLAITEEGVEYQVEILELTDDAFRIRIHSPGEPVEILFRPAAPETGPAESSDDMASTPVLTGTRWRLEDLAGKGVVDRAEATLEFVSDTAVSGNGSCNRFRGPVTVGRGTISFRALAATRMFCGEAVTNQETEYLAALAAAERWEVEEPFLRIYAAGRPEPLRFVRR